ncbi:Oplophorus-luciferin 2-monooxygenase non-catalytic subunit [Portunus trituberculatus]|uniref:Oplophorus-luciferin 2-monooxygenase non-catalytic subunit n=1 Tax=Portunus trituberculatus TaxID=210409 RepID=A0A5B7EK43_PORTR|nr:Oplophorus-luciferin 2-monooxygenase non-catalytic subunit [Portunus trituberculatus]
MSVVCYLTSDQDCTNNDSEKRPHSSLQPLPVGWSSCFWYLTFTPASSAFCSRVLLKSSFPTEPMKDGIVGLQLILLEVLAVCVHSNVKQGITHPKQAALTEKIVAGGCVYALPPQHTHHHPNFLETSQNTTSYIKGKETQVLTYQEKSDVKGKEATVVHDDKLASQDKSHNTPDNHIRSHYVPRNTEARILDMNRRYPSRGKLKTLPDLTRLSKEGTPQTNNTKTKECSFACPQAESITPCTCDPCARAINCSVVASFQQLFTIFHTAAFPNPRFESFLLVSPLLKNFKGSSRSDTFLANTFGDVSFTSIWVESMTSLTVVETGAFKGSEGTLTNLVFRWNYGLTHFPFDEGGVQKHLSITVEMCDSRKGILGSLADLSALTDGEVSNSSC